MAFAIKKSRKEVESLKQNILHLQKKLTCNNAVLWCSSKVKCSLCCKTNERAIKDSRILASFPDINATLTETMSK